jgi:hypothetical protein
LKSGGKSSPTISAKAGWSWGYVSALDSKGRTIFVADAHRDDGKRFVVRADEKLTPFLELELQAKRAIVCPLQSTSKICGNKHKK